VDGSAEGEVLVKTVPIAHNADLYQFTIDIMGEIVSIEVSRGNCNRPFVSVEQWEVPDKVLEKLVNVICDQ
jgi:hypothetical protein